jgi:hypothetical protein
MDIRKIIKEEIENLDFIENSKIEAAESLKQMPENSDFEKDPASILKSISSSNLEWGKLFRIVEELRGELRGQDALDTSATTRQVGQASVLLVLFELIIKTNLTISPNDVDIIINTFKNNFTSQTQVDALVEYEEKINS